LKNVQNETTKRFSVGNTKINIFHFISHLFIGGKIKYTIKIKVIS